MMSKFEQSLKPLILNVENPSRYFPSEYIFGKHDYQNGDLKCAMCFPDLYEIGMSNNAIRILYDLLNKHPGTYCDRVFAVAPDFEKVLRDSDLKLFTIEQQFPINELDFLGISIGYELLATNILQVLDLGGLSLRTDCRKETDPIVIAGGPAATNPVPFSPFVDFVYIGEAENGLTDVMDVLKNYKNRSERIEELKKLDFLWYSDKGKVTHRAIDYTFGTENENALLKYYAVPSFQVAQDHGTVEIMRGCPNGCRFCHAGQYYKPFRQRSISKLYELIAQSVNDFGYREVTLSSLSSGDYPELDKVIRLLNNNFAKKGVSFSLPSLKVSTFSLDILEQISEVRKSGLTFAIETPMLLNQRSMNKEVPVDSVIDIINEAKTRGWKLAKFYFMVGLPFVDMETEEQSIVEFLSKIRTATKINMNINIGTFIPKAHTPFQWARQLTMEESEKHLKSIKKALMTAIPGIKVSYHEPSISFIEGLISRGSSDCADLIEKAYNLGCRLDAWDEYLDFTKWQQAIDEISYDTDKRSFDFDEELPWDSVSLNVSKQYLLKELKKAENSELTGTCCSNCDHNCGVCGNKQKVIKANEEADNVVVPEPEDIPEGPYNQVIFVYSKKGRAVFNSHIAVMRQFEMAFQRCNLHVKFTEGFNPKPKMEFLNPITMGVEGENELLLVELPVSEINNDSIDKLNSVLAEGFTVKSLKHIEMPDSGAKISLASHMTGCSYTISDVKDEILLKALNDKTGETEDYSLSAENGVYNLKLKGEKNLYKLLFGPEVSKFHVTGSCRIVRNKLDLDIKI